MMLDEAKVRKVLQEHWLTHIVCDHEAKTDISVCYCVAWRSNPVSSVGAAINLHVEHVMQELRRS